MEQNNQNDARPSNDGSEHGSPLSKVKNHKTAWIIGGIVAVLLVAGAAFMLTYDPASKDRNSTFEASSNSGQDLFKQQYGQNCQDKDVAFTSAPMKMDELSYIRPLGAVSDGHVTPTDHVYIGGPNPNAADNSYAVLMPANGTVVEVSAMPAQYIGDMSGQQLAPEDHRIVISHSCRYYSIYIHVHTLSDKLKEAVETLEPNESKQVNVELKAGDVVGYIGGSTFDWTPVDTTVTLTGFIDPTLYEGESWKIHTVSPFDLYTGTLKTSLEAKSLRSVAPIGGKIDYDQAGKLIGNWFRKDSGGYSGNSSDGRYWDGHLAVVPDYIDPTYTDVSIGNWQGSARQFVVVGKVDPSKIAEADGLVKYELRKLGYVTPANQSWNGSSFVKGVHPSEQGSVEGVIAFQVLPNEQLKIEKFPGKTAAQVTAFTSAAETYER